MKKHTVEEIEEAELLSFTVTEEILLHKERKMRNMLNNRRRHVRKCISRMGMWLYDDDHV